MTQVEGDTAVGVIRALSVVQRIHAEGKGCSEANMYRYELPSSLLYLRSNLLKLPSSILPLRGSASPTVLIFINASPKPARGGSWEGIVLDSAGNVLALDKLSWARKDKRVMLEDIKWEGRYEKWRRTRVCPKVYDPVQPLEFILSKSSWDRLWQLAMGENPLGHPENANRSSIA